jgi:hypothetical protein
MILRNDADEVFLSVLDEIHLLVYLCTAVFPSVPKSELVSKSTLARVIMFTILSGFWGRRLRGRPRSNFKFGRTLCWNE